jgi:vitamin B12 transporter
MPRFLGKGRAMLFSGLVLSSALSLHGYSESLPTFTFATSNVTAAKYITPIEKSNNKVSVMTRQELEWSGATSVRAALNGIPGVTAVNAGGTAGVFLRGLASNQTKVVLDGIPLTDPSTPQNTPYLDTLVFDQVDKIEVIEGAKSTLYGSQALGGVINIIPKKTGNSLDFRVGNNKRSDSWAINPTVGNTQFHFGAGRQLDESLSASRFGSEKDKAEQEVFRAGFDQNVGIGTLEVSYIKGKAYFDLDEPYDLGKSAAVIDDPNYTLTTDQDLTLTKLTVPFNPSFINTLTYRTFYITRAVKNGTDANHLLDSLDNSTRGQADEVELTILNKLTSNWDLLWGGSIYNENMVEYSNSTSPFGPYSYTTGPAHQRRAGYFVQQNLNLDRLTFNGGIRQDEYISIENTKRPFTYSIGVGYKIPVVETTLKGNMNSGFRNPGLYEKTYFGNPAPLNAETSFTKDLILEKSWDNTRFSVTVFESLVDSKIMFNTDGFYYQNATQIIRTTGVHYQIGFTDLGILDMLNMGYLNQRSDGGSWINSVRVPEQSVTCSGGKQWGPLSFGFSVLYNSTRVDSVGFPGTPVYLRYYTLVNTRIAYQLTPKVSTYLLVQNLLNMSYEEVAGYSTAERNAQLGMHIDL